VASPDRQQRFPFGPPEAAGSGGANTGPTARARSGDAGERERVATRLAHELGQEAGVAFAYLHGSFVGGTAFHDVDVAVVAALPSAEAFPVAALAERLSAAGALPVDVRLLNGAPVSFAYHAFRGRLLFSRDEELLTGVLEDAARRYLDAEPLLRQATREAFAR